MEPRHLAPWRPPAGAAEGVPQCGRCASGRHSRPPRVDANGLAGPPAVAAAVRLRTRPGPPLRRPSITSA
eukprot:3193563-Lingulodinium_polyedra.AAC.1